MRAIKNANTGIPIVESLSDRSLDCFGFRRNSMDFDIVDEERSRLGRSDGVRFGRDSDGSTGIVLEDNAPIDRITSDRGSMGKIVIGIVFETEVWIVDVETAIFVCSIDGEIITRGVRSPTQARPPLLFCRCYRSRTLYRTTFGSSS